MEEDGTPKDPDRAVVDGLEQVQNLHAQRVQAYKKWDSAFKDYIASEDLTKGYGAYQALVEAVTKEFADISGQIREIASAFDRQQRADLSHLLRRVQEAEKDKLQLTVAVQLGTVKSVQEHGEEKDFVWEREAKEKTNQIYKLMEQINESLEELRYARFELQQE